MKELATALLLAYGAAALFFPARSLKAPLRSAVLLLCSGIICLSPLAIPAGHPFLRLFVGLSAVALPLKLYDLHRHPEYGKGMTPGEYLADLPNWFSLVWGKNPRLPRPERGREVRRLLAGGAGLASVIAMGYAVFTRPWHSAPFLVEHAVKATVCYVTALLFGEVGAAFWRLAGQPVRVLFDSPHRAVTPADFWRRWNRPVRQFFWEDVFKPAKGLRNPVRAAWVTFGLSALVHETLFGIAIGRVQGYQTAFFLLQACGSILTLRLKPKGRAALAGNGLTLLFMVLTSVFFFLSVNSVVPFYDPLRPLPAWMSPR